MIQIRKLYTRRDMFEVGTQLTFRDSDKKIIYFLSGHLGGHQGRIDLFDIQGKLLAEARQKSLGFFPKFIFLEDGHYAGSLRRYYGINHDMLFVKKLNWFIFGNLFTFNYKVFKGRDCIMKIHEVTLPDGGNYLEFEISHKEYEPLCLCIASILDYWAKVRNPSHSNQTELNNNLNVNYS